MTEETPGGGKLNVFIATLPPGDDPDSFVRREGGPALQAIIDAAKPAGVWVLEHPEAKRLPIPRWMTGEEDQP